MVDDDGTFQVTLTAPDAMEVCRTEVTAVSQFLELRGVRSPAVTRAKPGRRDMLRQSTILMAPAAVAAALLAGAPAALAAEFPENPIEITELFGAGGYSAI